MLCISGHSMLLHLSLSSMHHVVTMMVLSESSPHVMPLQRLPPYASSAELSALKIGLAVAQLPVQVDFIAYSPQYALWSTILQRQARMSSKGK